MGRRALCARHSSLPIKTNVVTIAMVSSHQPGAGGHHSGAIGATSDEQWLTALDTISNGQEFSAGCGQILGTQRFSPGASAEVAALDQLLQKLLTHVHPTRTPLLLAESSND